MSASPQTDPAPGAVSPPKVERLKAGSVGLTGVMFMALATAAPITAMTGNLPIIIGSGSGAHAPGAFLFVTGVLLLFTVGYVAMARHITAAGAFYGYISHGLGRVAGMASGLLAYRGKGAGMTDAELDVLFERRFAYQKAHATTNMREIVALAHRYEIPLASHDDTTDENVADAVRDRVSVAEFPTTIEAARGLHQAGIGILMGAPNVVRGGSHSGNIAAVDLAREGLLDILSSDYIPSSLLMAALQLPQRVPGIDLASAIRTVTKTPAGAVGLADRGEIVPGKRADLIRVHVARDCPVVRSVWREGRRVA